LKATEHPIIKGKYLIKKFSGKGGWFYKVIPEIVQDKNSTNG
jgi:hypothetical protein